MTLDQLLRALTDLKLPDSTPVRTSDDLDITGVTVERGADGHLAIYLDDNGDAE